MYRTRRYGLCVEPFRISILLGVVRRGMRILKKMFLTVIAVIFLSVGIMIRDDDVDYYGM